MTFFELQNHLILSKDITKVKSYTITFEQTCLKLSKTYERTVKENHRTNKESSNFAIDIEWREAKDICTDSWFFQN